MYVIDFLKKKIKFEEWNANIKISGQKISLTAEKAHFRKV